MSESEDIAELRKKIIDETEKRLKDGRLPKKVPIYEVDDDGEPTGEVEEREVDDPELYVKYKIDKYKLSMGVNEEAALELIARSEYALDTTEPLTESELYESIESNIRNLSDGDKLVNIKAKVLSGFIKNITAKKDGKVYRIATVHIADGTGVAEISIFYNNKYDELFEKIEDKTIRGKSVYIEGFDVQADSFSPFDLVLKPNRSGAQITFIDENVDAGEYLTPIDEINSATKVAHIRGKVIELEDAKTITYKRGSKAGKNGFVQSCKVVDKDGHYIKVSMWDDATEDPPEQDSIVELIGLGVYLDKGEQKQGKTVYSTSLKDKGRFNKISGDADEYSDTLIEQSLPISQMIEKNVGEPFEAIAKVYALRWTKKDPDSKDFNAVIKQDPYYRACNRTDKDYTCLKKTVKQADGSYECAEGHAQAEEDTQKRLLLRANVSDGTMTMEASFFHQDAEAIFEKSGDEVIDEYENAGSTTDERYDRFFTKYNQKLNGEKFKIRGTLFKDGQWGIKLQVSKIERIDLNESIKQKVSIFG